MSRTLRARVAIAVAGATLVAATLAFATASALDPSTVPNAIDYLASQQNGGDDPATGSGAWDTDPSSPFVTYDAVLAVAEAAQTTSTWSTDAAYGAVAGFENDQGVDPLAFLDLMAAELAAKGPAGKTAVMLAGPLGLPYDAYDPMGDGDPVDLVALVGEPNANGAYDIDLFFNNTLFAALAAQLFTGSMSPSTVAYIEACQQESGAWSFDCTPDGFVDVDTTALAIQALVAGGRSPGDPSVAAGLAYLADQLEPEGYWSAFGFPSSESTSRAMIAVAAAGYDVDTPCWRNTVMPSLASEPFVPADDALESLVNPDGSIAGAGSFLPAWSTAQSVSGLLRHWFPTVTAAPQQCVVAGPPPVVSNTAPLAGGQVTVSGNGFAGGAELTIELFSDPVLLATAHADALGAYSVTVTIPVGTPPGEHEIVVTGLGPDGQLVRSSTAIVVLDPADAAGPGSAPAGPSPTFVG